MSKRSVKRLGREFFNQSALQVARQLLGQVLVRKVGRKVLRAKIVETESYKGPLDAAAHTYKNRRTARTEVIFGEGGLVYVYLVYGLHWQLNFSAAGPGRPEAVLIRGIVLNGRKISGPGLVAKALRVDKSLYGEDATVSAKLWVEKSSLPNFPARIKRGPRVGVAYAGEWAKKPWRFRLQ